MAEWIETYRGTVYARDEDQNGHIGNVCYVTKFDEATWQFLSMLGLSRAYFKSEDRALPAVRQNIRYVRELAGGDLITVETALQEMSARKLRYVHRMIDAETAEEVAEMELIGVHIDRETRRACPFPDEIRANGARLLGGVA